MNLHQNGGYALVRRNKNLYHCSQPVVCCAGAAPRGYRANRLRSSHPTLDQGGGDGQPLSSAELHAAPSLLAKE